MQKERDSKKKNPSSCFTYLSNKHRRRAQNLTKPLLGS